MKVCEKIVARNQFGVAHYESDEKRNPIHKKAANGCERRNLLFYKVKEPANGK